MASALANKKETLDLALISSLDRFVSAAGFMWQTILLKSNYPLSFRNFLIGALLGQFILDVRQPAPVLHQARLASSCAASVHGAARSRGHAPVRPQVGRGPGCLKIL